MTAFEEDIFPHQRDEGYRDEAHTLFYASTDLLLRLREAADQPGDPDADAELERYAQPLIGQPLAGNYRLNYYYWKKDDALHRSGFPRGFIYRQVIGLFGGIEKVPGEDSEFVAVDPVADTNNEDVKAFYAPLPELKKRQPMGMERHQDTRILIPSRALINRDVSFDFAYLHEAARSAEQSRAALHAVLGEMGVRTAPEE